MTWNRKTFIVGIVVLVFAGSSAWLWTRHRGPAVEWRRSTWSGGREVVEQYIPGRDFPFYRAVKTANHTIFGPTDDCGFRHGEWITVEDKPSRPEHGKLRTETWFYHDREVSQTEWALLTLADEKNGKLADAIERKLTSCYP